MEEGNRHHTIAMDMHNGNASSLTRHNLPTVKQGVSFRGIALAVLLAISLAFIGCAHVQPTVWREYKVFCGMSGQNGDVTEADWRRFCDEHVTTAFPDGYTSFEAIGYWKGSATTTARENSRVLLIVAPVEAKGKVLALARKYREMFHQEAVLVVTSPGDAIFVEAANEHHHLQHVHD